MTLTKEQHQIWEKGFHTGFQDGFQSGFHDGWSAGWKDGKQPAPVQFEMYDAVDLSQIPSSSGAVAGYVDGHWATYSSLVKRWPHAKHLSIAVSASADAQCLDVEQGDASPSEAVAWYKRQHARGVTLPAVYCSVSVARTVLDLLEHAGIPRSHLRLWSAHYTGRPHLCGPQCGFGLNTTADATQWTDRALGRNLDESLCRANFL